MTVSDEEYYVDENTSNTSKISKRGDTVFMKQKAGMQKGELEEQLRGYIAVWKKQRAKEEEELKRLKDKQAKRKEIRAEQEKKLAAQKREEEERARKDAGERRAIRDFPILYSLSFIPETSFFHLTFSNSLFLSPISCLNDIEHFFLKFPSLSEQFLTTGVSLFCSIFSSFFVVTLEHKCLTLFSL